MSFLKNLVSSSNYNYYPNTTIELCVISYSDINTIAGQVATNTNLQVVWGPFEHLSDLGVAYSLMYVAKNPQTGEYFVVIRGTNPLSLESWLGQDFDVSTSQPFGSLPGNPPGVPSSALISQGTFNGMSDLISLSDGSGGLNVVDFLKSENPKSLYVTGHSLGGTLTPPLFAYLNAMLNGAGPANSMALWSYAGLTAGGTGFNEYFNNVLINDQGFKWRIQNTLDIAPHMWYSKSAIENIYAAQDLKWSFIVKDLVDKLFKEAAEANIGYSQPQVGQPIPGTFDTSFPADDVFAFQAMHQHHATTYKPMISSFYPM